MWHVSRSAGPGRVRRLFRYQGRDGTWTAWPGGVRAPEVAETKVASSEALGGERDPTPSQHICAPMTSRVVLIGVEVDQKVEAGALVAVVEAMKMEYPLVSQISGRVASIHHKAQDKVRRGDVVVTIAPQFPTCTPSPGAQS